MSAASVDDLRALREQLVHHNRRRRPPLTVEELVAALPGGWQLIRTEPRLVARFERIESTYYQSAYEAETLLRRVRLAQESIDRYSGQPRRERSDPRNSAEEI